MQERKGNGELLPDQARMETQSAEMGSGAGSDEEPEQLLFANSCRSYFQFQLRTEE